VEDLTELVRMVGADTSGRVSRYDWKMEDHLAVEEGHHS
jgi:hypothetical protein